MMRSLALSLAGLVCAALSGCAGTPKPKAPEPTSAADVVQSEALLGIMLPPASFGGSAVFDQQLSGRAQGRDMTLRVRVEVQPDQLVMGGFSPLGVPLFTLTHTAEGLKTSSLGGRNPPFDPRYVVVDFQLAFWPSDVLAPAIAAKGFRFEEQAAPKRRLVYTGSGELVVEVDYTSDTDGTEHVKIRHVLPEFAVSVRSRRVEGQQ